MVKYKKIILNTLSQAQDQVSEAQWSATSLAPPGFENVFFVDLIIIIMIRIISNMMIIMITIIILTLIHLSYSLLPPHQIMCSAHKLTRVLQPTIMINEHNDHDDDHYDDKD